MVPVFVLTTFLVVKVRKSLRDCIGHGVEKKRCDVSMIGNARKNSSEKGMQEIGDFGYKAGMRTFIAVGKWIDWTMKMQIPFRTDDERLLVQKPGILMGYQNLEIHYQ